MPDQRCPNCSAQHDVSIFVSGQRVRCSKCGIRFVVTRSDASVVTDRGSSKRQSDHSGESVALAASDVPPVIDEDRRDAGHSPLEKAEPEVEAASTVERNGSSVRDFG